MLNQVLPEKLPISLIKLSLFVAIVNCIMTSIVSAQVLQPEEVDCNAVVGQGVLTSEGLVPVDVYCKNQIDQQQQKQKISSENNASNRFGWAGKNNFPQVNSSEIDKLTCYFTTPDGRILDLGTICGENKEKDDSY